jgi:hypothetical protein
MINCNRDCLQVEILKSGLLANDKLQSGWLANGNCNRSLQLYNFSESKPPASRVYTVSAGKVDALSHGVDLLRC